MLLFFDSSAVVPIGSNAIVRPSAGQEVLVLNLFNANAASRTVTFNVSGQEFTVTIASNAALTMAIEREGDISASASGAGVYAWVGRRTNS